MNESRRGFVKKAAVVGAVVAIGATAQAAGAKGSNGVIVGKSKKIEINYKKTQAWEDYYKTAL